MNEDRFNLERFVRRQEEDYGRAYKELSEESKRSHWMWWIFPQITGLGMTSTSQEYSIKSLAEAKVYLEHPVLGKNIREGKFAQTGNYTEVQCALIIMSIVLHLQLKMVYIGNNLLGAAVKFLAGRCQGNGMRNTVEQLYA
jgi:hypothetical protein